MLDTAKSLHKLKLCLAKRQFFSHTKNDLRFIQWDYWELPNRNGCNQDWVTPGCHLRREKTGFISASGHGRAMETFGSCLSMECQVFSGHHAFSHKLKEVSSEKPKNMSQDNRIIGRRRWPQDRFFAVAYAIILIFEMSQSEIFCSLYTFWKWNSIYFKVFSVKIILPFFKVYSIKKIIYLLFSGAICNSIKCAEK